MQNKRQPFTEDKTDNCRDFLIEINIRFLAADFTINQVRSVTLGFVSPQIQSNKFTFPVAIAPYLAT